MATSTDGTENGVAGRWWPIAMVLLAVAGFFPTYFGRFPRFEGTSASVHFHVATMLAWIGLAIAQPILVRRGRLEWHRRLGKLTYALLPVIALGFGLILRDGQLRHKEPALILATAFDASMFFFLVGMGIFYRKRRAYHAAFMMLTLVPFLNPTVGRLISPAVSVPLELVVLLSLLVYARVRRRETRPFSIALAAFACALAGLVVVMVGMPTAPDALWALLFA